MPSPGNTRNLRSSYAEQQSHALLEPIRAAQTVLRAMREQRAQSERMSQHQQVRYLPLVCCFENTLLCGFKLELTVLCPTLQARVTSQVTYLLDVLLIANTLPPQKH